jgi:integrase
VLDLCAITDTLIADADGRRDRHRRRSPRRTDWAGRDRALVLTSLLAGLRADELLRANVGDIRTTDEGGVIHVRGKGGTNRRIPIEQKLIEALDSYRDSRAVRFPRWQQTPPYCQRIGCVAATLPYSWVATVNASPAAHFNTACCARTPTSASTR